MPKTRWPISVVTVCSTSSSDRASLKHCAKRMPGRRSEKRKKSLPSPSPSAPSCDSWARLWPMKRKCTMPRVTSISESEPPFGKAIGLKIKFLMSNRFGDLVSSAIGSVLSGRWRDPEILVLVQHVVNRVLRGRVGLEDADRAVVDVAVLVEADEPLQGLDIGSLDGVAHR